MPINEYVYDFTESILQSLLTSIQMQAARLDKAETDTVPYSAQHALELANNRMHVLERLVKSDNFISTTATDLYNQEILKTGLELKAQSSAVRAAFMQECKEAILCLLKFIIQKENFVDNNVFNIIAFYSAEKKSELIDFVKKKLLAEGAFPRAQTLEQWVQTDHSVIEIAYNHASAELPVEPASSLLFFTKPLKRQAPDYTESVRRMKLDIFDGYASFYYADQEDIFTEVFLLLHEIHFSFFRNKMQTASRQQCINLFEYCRNAIVEFVKDAKPHRGLTSNAKELCIANISDFFDIYVKVIYGDIDNLDVLFANYDEHTKKYLQNKLMQQACTLIKQKYDEYESSNNRQPSLSLQPA